MIYVNSDASYRDGWAGIAYQSDSLESHSRLVECQTSSEAELRALLLAMSAAERAGLADVVFRTDCESAAQPDRGKNEYLRPLRDRVASYLAAHPGWCVKKITRTENVLANTLARQARRSADDVTVTVHSEIAAALIERAGIPETRQGRWQVSPDRRSSSRTAALTAALVLLAKGATPIPACAEAPL
jgi:hypothetical protein